MPAIRSSVWNLKPEPPVNNSAYTASWVFRQTHFSTIYPTVFRAVPPIPFSRERLPTPDGDFLDVDFLLRDFDKVVVLCHGLEGSTQGKYMRGMARHFHNHGWDVAAMNFRGCSGEPNLRPRTYHSGATDDLKTVLQNVADKGYKKAALVGFSLGGNLILKYLGENAGEVWSKIIGAVTFSVPVDLGDAGREISSPKNWIYNQRFLRRLKKKVIIKAGQFPDEIEAGSLRSIKTLTDFDNIFTGPLHGFDGAQDYYRQCSSRQFLSNIRIPTLLVSAQNDPFLGEQCYPHQEAANSNYFKFENPKHGGHVGFYSPGSIYWSEARALEFIQEQL
ncbi:MAG: alpha/beta fold hydrolase [bacterium]|nr:alpha/beta fold hydrolase [bacterium]